MRGKSNTRTWGVSELRRLRQLDEENSRLQRLVADLSLDEHMLSEALREKVYGPPAAASSPSGFRRRFRFGVREPAGWRYSVGRPDIAAVKRGTNRPYACEFGTLLSAVHVLGICGSACSCVGKAGG